MNTQEQSYINGFVKRAIEAGLTEKQALDLAATQPVMDNPSQSIGLALNPAQQQINAGGNYINPVNFKMEDLAKDFQSKGRLNDLSKEILGRTPYPVSGGAGNYLMNANKINQLGQNILKQSASSPARCWEGYEPVPGKKAYSNDSCRKKTPKKNMNTKQAYINGFLKRAAEYGLTEAQVADLLKLSEAPLPVAYGQTPVNQAAKDLVSAPFKAVGNAASGVGDYIKNNYRKVLGLDNPSVSDAGPNRKFNQTLNRPVVKPQ